MTPEDIIADVRGKQDLKDLNDLLDLHREAFRIANERPIPPPCRPLPGLAPTLMKLCECLALIDAGYIKSSDPLWGKRAH